MDKKSSMILDVIQRLKHATGRAPCKKTVQKVVYLLEEAEESPEFDYTIHFYGPYSADLDYEIQDLAAQGVLNIDYTDRGHFISVNDTDEMGDVQLSVREQEIIDSFGKESPSKLELVATTLFVQRAKNATDTSQILPGVKKIKGSKYSDREICDAIGELHSQNYF